jgi:hypothetical protein
MAIDKSLSLGLGIEVLGGSSTRAGAAFRTPLATLHLFQGWADQFLVTPDTGIEDTYASLTWSRWGWTAQAVLHRFDAAAGSSHWGDELDLSFAHRLGERYSLLLKAALFSAEDPAYVDVNKFWLMVTADY